MVNNYQGLEIFQDADTVGLTGHYGNNLFYASADTYTDTTVTPNISINLRSNFYPGDGVGKPQSTDLISNAVGNNDPLFVSFDGKFATPNGAPNNNDFHLQSSSPAFGKGNAAFSNDLGAYTSDAVKSNQH